MLAKLVPTLSDWWCQVVSVTDPYGSNLFSKLDPLLFLSSSSLIVLVGLLHMFVSSMYCGTSSHVCAVHVLWDVFICLCRPYAVEVLMCFVPSLYHRELYHWVHCVLRPHPISISRYVSHIPTRSASSGQPPGSAALFRCGRSRFLLDTARREYKLWSSSLRNLHHPLTFESQFRSAFMATKLRLLQWREWGSIPGRDKFFCPIHTYFSNFIQIIQIIFFYISYTYYDSYPNCKKVEIVMCFTEIWTRFYKKKQFTNDDCSFS
jgi:hypothetical protein